MKAFKMDKVIENHVIDIKFILQKIEKEKQDLKEPLKRRKELAIQIKQFSYEEIETEGLFGSIIPNDKAYTNLLEKKKKWLNEEIRGLKIEHEIQYVRLCEVTRQKKKDEEDRTMVEEDKREMATKLEERI